MSMMSTPISSAAVPAQAADANPAVRAAQTPSAAAGQQPAASGAPAPAAAASPAPFAQWLGQQAAAVPADAALAATPAAAGTAGDGGTATPAPGAGDGKAAAADDGDTGAAQDGTLLAAMAMPLMPLTPMQIAQAVQSAQGNGNGNAAAADDGSTGNGAAVKVPAAGQAAAPMNVTAAGQDGSRRADIALARLPAQAAQDARPDEGAVRLAVQAAASNTKGNGGAADAQSFQDSGADHAAAPTNGTPVNGPVIAATPASTQPAPDTVKLAGPPTAWRQSLQEALGERLQLQVGKNMEQAVIRLEPPQLGRIDIAIRHSNGMLEVNISATHGEVLRQLQSVSDNLRSDLSQRQYTEVAVSVTPTPKHNGASPFGDPQQERGRRQARDQEEQQPGRALAEAANSTSVFSLDGRG